LVSVLGHDRHGDAQPVDKAGKEFKGAGGSQELDDLRHRKSALELSEKLVVDSVSGLVKPFGAAETQFFLLRKRPASKPFATVAICFSSAPF
jgi:hypothetical protein